MDSQTLEQKVRQLIDKSLHMSLATCAGEQPWVCEVHFAYDGSLNLYFRSLMSRRHSQEIAGNPKVAGNIIDKHALGEPVVGLYFEAVAERLQDVTTTDAAFICLRERLQLIESAVAEAQDPTGHQFYRLTVTNWNVFGKFDTERGQKYTLPWTGEDR